MDGVYFREDSIVCEPNSLAAKAGKICGRKGNPKAHNSERAARLLHVNRAEFCPFRRDELESSRMEFSERTGMNARLATRFASGPFCLDLSHDFTHALLLPLEKLFAVRRFVDQWRPATAERSIASSAHSDRYASGML